VQEIEAQCVHKTLEKSSLSGIRTEFKSPPNSSHRLPADRMANQPAIALALNPIKLAGTPLCDSKTNPTDHATKPAIIALLPTPGRACWLGKKSAIAIGTNNETSTSTNDNSKSPMIDSPENATASEPAITNPTLARVPQT
jgi:hypothetical protein